MDLFKDAAFFKTERYKNTKSWHLTTGPTKIRLTPFSTSILKK